MCATFSGDDVGKTVRDREGTAIGTVEAIDGDTARVEVDSGVTESIKSALGWGDDEGDASVDGRNVEKITDEAVVLGDDSSLADEEAGDGSLMERTEGSEKQDATPAPDRMGGEEPEGRNESEGGSGSGRPPNEDRTVTKDRGRKEDR